MATDKLSSVSKFGPSKAIGLSNSEHLMHRLLKITPGPDLGARVHVLT